MLRIYIKLLVTFFVYFLIYFCLFLSNRAHLKVLSAKKIQDQKTLEGLTPLLLPLLPRACYVLAHCDKKNNKQMQKVKVDYKLFLDILDTI